MAADLRQLVERLWALSGDFPVEAARSTPNLKAAAVFAKATEGTATWYTMGKRHVHEPQLEAFAEVVGGHLDGVEAVVELGAGKGLLGRVVQEATGARVVAIERRDCAHFDGHDVTRLVADLNEVALNDVIPARSLLLAKHFCGPASDTAIRMATEAGKVVTVALAPCCHPQIEWETYTGREHLAKWMEGLTPVGEDGVTLDGQSAQSFGPKKKSKNKGKRRQQRQEGEEPTGAPDADQTTVTAAAPVGAVDGDDAEHATPTAFGADDFAVLLDLIFLSRYGKRGMSDSDCKSWSVLRSLGDDVCYRAGRAARRVIEEARAAYLRDHGFAVKLVQYVSDAISPDNMILLGQRGGARTTTPPSPHQQLALPPRPLCTTRFPGPRGVVLHVNGEQGLTDRVAEYFLEYRAALLPGAAAAGVPPAVTGVGLHHLVHGGLMVVVLGDVPAILRHLLDSAALTRAVDLVVPFDQQRILSALGGTLVPATPASPAATTEEPPAKKAKKLMEGAGGVGGAPADPAAAAAAAAAAYPWLHEIVNDAAKAKATGKTDGQEGSTPAIWRVCCLPKPLERACVDLGKAAGMDFHPVNFTHTLFVLQWVDRLGGEAVYHSVVARTVFDLRQWRAVGSNAITLARDGAALATLAKAKERTLYGWIAEMEDRNPGTTVKGKSVLVVSDDAKDPNLPALETILGYFGARRTAVVHPKRLDDPARGGSARGEEGARGEEKDEAPPVRYAVATLPDGFDAVDLVVFILDRGEQPQTLRATFADPSSHPVVRGFRGAVYGRAKLGVQARSRHVTSRQIAEWRAAGFARTHLRHLLGDREHDRTVVAQWEGGTAQP